jgi:hypothetical protein
MTVVIKCPKIVTPIELINAPSLEPNVFITVLLVKKVIGFVYLKGHETLVKTALTILRPVKDTWFVRDQMRCHDADPSVPWKSPQA